jgi:hypothetical protein
MRGAGQLAHPAPARQAGQAAGEMSGQPPGTSTKCSASRGQPAGEMSGFRASGLKLTAHSTSRGQSAASPMLVLVCFLCSTCMSVAGHHPKDASIAACHSAAALVPVLWLLLLQQREEVLSCTHS